MYNLSRKIFFILLQGLRSKRIEKILIGSPRVGRFFAVDPLAGKYPWYTPYQFSGNKVIAFVELEGLEESKELKFPSPPTEHKIEKGETLTSIAKKYGTTVKDLSKWNHISNPDKIYAGNSIVVSDPTEYNNFRNTPVWKYLGYSEGTTTIIFSQNKVVARSEQYEKKWKAIHTVDAIFDVLSLGYLINDASLNVYKSRKISLYSPLSKVDKVLEEANAGVVRSRYSLTYDEAMQAGKKWVGENPEIRYYEDGKIKEMYSLGRTRRFRAPAKKNGEFSDYDANFERLNDGETYEYGVNNPWNSKYPGARYTNTHVVANSRKIDY